MVKRFNFEGGADEEPDGQFVLYEDYEKLLNDYRRMKNSYEISLSETHENSLEWFGTHEMD